MNFKLLWPIYWQLFTFYLSDHRWYWSKFHRSKPCNPLTCNVCVSFFLGKAVLQWIYISFGNNVLLWGPPEHFGVVFVILPAVGKRYHLGLAFAPLRLNRPLLCALLTLQTQLGISAQNRSITSVYERFGLINVRWQLNLSSPQQAASLLFSSVDIKFFCGTELSTTSCFSSGPLCRYWILLWHRTDHWNLFLE